MVGEAREEYFSGSQVIGGRADRHVDMNVFTISFGSFIFTPLRKARLCKTISCCYRYVLGSR